MSTVKKAKRWLHGGFVAVIGVFGIAVLIAFALLPWLIAGVWHLGNISFEAAVIMLLIIACYSGATSHE